MVSRLSIFFVCLLLPHYLSRAEPSRWITWDIGQGSFTTVVNPESCQIIEAGGEFINWKSFEHECRHKKAEVFTSHSDLDHISFLRKVLSLATSACRQGITPPSDHRSRRKDPILKQLTSLSPCPTSQNTMLIWTPPKEGRLKTNESSQIALIDQIALVTGDSPKSQEKIWSRALPISDAKYLLLGHHGSRTSTSKELLERMPHLKMAVASARFKKYRHPHIETEQILKLHGVALLRTEDWGTISFPLP